MVVTFFGHSDFCEGAEYEQKMLDILEETVGDEPAELYLGNYGRFDAFAYFCAKKYKETHPRVRLIFITPYMTDEYQKNHLNYLSGQYDEIIYPPLETVPPRFAISHRNRWMAEAADIVIAYIYNKKLRRRI